MFYFNNNYSNYIMKLIYLLYVIIFLIVLDILFSLWRNYRRKTKYLEAKERSKSTNKKLLVIGNPNAGFWNKHIQKAYGCGDICLDLMGCDCEKQIKGDILETLKKIKDNKLVIFESCVLEYVDKKSLPEIEKEIQRVSNGDYFGVRISPNIFTTNLDFIQFG